MVSSNVSDSLITIIIVLLVLDSPSRLNHDSTQISKFQRYIPLPKKSYLGDSFFILKKKSWLPTVICKTWDDKSVYPVVCRQTIAIGWTLQTGTRGKYSLVRCLACYPDLAGGSVLSAAGRVWRRRRPACQLHWPAPKDEGHKDQR